MAQVYIFPSSRHRRIVEFISAEMQKRPSVDDAEQYLIDHLDIEWNRLAGLGITEAEIEQHCHAFALKAWRSFFDGRQAQGVA
ncbi:MULTISPECIES: DUF6074 family protein [unclassified Bradyrhizobium]|uniref:DUF6074 family protein n=1 Tax=unclassified Bradyrhizobium TaxID=2631580 RepID=UPI001FFA652F|nr:MULTISPECIES: DUF6074 family protein [unclassified Bradyrhizobium]MCK1474905.1 hypothetical protein [Bradyrhizobium sp. 197]MCK1656055.1 hypothetical protein [Bradyrhizobium sp. 151]UPJ57654.1 hypothetical protein IVB24_34745 [Bradyrhizobium sp. 192]